MRSENSNRRSAGQEECLVCFALLNGGQGFAQVLHQGEMAKFCSLECMEIFQNNPESFLRRMKPPAKPPPADPQVLDGSTKPDSTERRQHGA